MTLKELRKEIFFELLDGNEAEAFRLVAKYEALWKAQKSSNGLTSELETADRERHRTLLQQAQDQWEKGDRDRARITASTVRNHRK